jgi:uncharacterized cofD-like protein
LLIKEISQEIADSDARKIYVCNIMTQPGETDHYSVSDHIDAILNHADYKDIMDAVLVNDSLPANLAEKYRAADSFPVKIDAENVKKIGVKIVSKKLIEESKEGLVRHSSNRVARAIYHWYRRDVRFNKGNKEKKELITK